MSDEILYGSDKRWMQAERSKEVTVRPSEDPPLHPLFAMVTSSFELATAHMAKLTDENA